VGQPVNVTYWHHTADVSAGREPHTSPYMALNADSCRSQPGSQAVVGEARRAASADAVVSVDALHLAPDLAAAGREVLRILRPSHRLVLTSWQPRTPEDARLPSRLRIDWTTALRSVGFVDVQVESRAEWHELFTRVYRVALDLGSPGEDVAPTGLQDEARRHLPIAELVDRVVVTATRPDGGVAAGPAG
jgi:SAM-dependent methyltransferase